ncbi:MAG: hypothetical protein EBR40_10595 [Proteobacteria bacterium]|nr:hypothetical protein [Pseudomonadota bacterium]
MSDPSEPQSPEELLAKAKAVSPGDPLLCEVPVRAPDGSVVYRPNWDGGLCAGVPPEGEIPEALRDASLAFLWLSKVSSLASFATGEIAKNDFRKAINSAREKANASTGRLAESYSNIGELSSKILGIAGELDGLKAELDSIRLSMAPDLGAINAISSQISSLETSLASANAKLESANLAKQYAENRANFPAGIPGSKLQRDAIVKATADVANAKSAVNSVERDISARTSELSGYIDSYNSKGEDAVDVAKEILAKQAESEQLESQVASQSSATDSAMRQRSEAVMDMVEAQKKFKSDMERSFALAQATVGLSGTSRVLNYIATSQYYMATGEAISTSVGISSSLNPDWGLVPYVGLIQKAVISASKTLEGSGDFMMFLEQFGQATLATASIESSIHGLEEAGNMLDRGQDYQATIEIARQTSAGVEILGIIGETTITFVPGGGAVSPIIPPATKIASGGLSGMIGMIGEAGYLAGEGRAFSAPLGTGQISGVTMVVFGTPYVVYASAKNALFSVFGGEQEDILKTLSDMARSGKTILPPLRGSDLELYPLRPTVPDYPYTFPNLPPSAIAEEY